MRATIDILQKGIALGLLIVLTWNTGRIASNLDRLADGGVTVIADQSDVRRSYD